ncbi:MAG TPA: cadmium resistance transporter [Oculatellaceae cyanobacterium]|jgi:cadmium resistance transport/sequestration family protein
MSEFLPAISTGLASFTATNIDDIVILSVFFSQVNAIFRRRHIVTGQYLGFGALVGASLPGFFGSLIIPQDYIGILGVVPIAIGLNRWLNPDTDDSDSPNETPAPQNSLLSSVLSPQTYGVAAVTVANGSDNISIYVPLFANSTWESLLVIVSVFFSLVGVWCYTAYKLTQTKAIANVLTQYGNSLVPFVLMALGVSILIESNTLASIPLTLLTLIAGGCCWLMINKNKPSEVENY